MPSRSEAKTRKELIDPALTKAGWDVTNRDQVGLEIPIDGFDSKAWKRLEAKLKRLKEHGAAYSLDLPKGISDYALYRPNGEIIVIIEAKRTSIAPRLAQAQTEFYKKFTQIVQKTERLRAQQRSRRSELKFRAGKKSRLKTDSGPALSSKLDLTSPFLTDLR